MLSSKKSSLTENNQVVILEKLLITARKKTGVELIAIEITLEKLIQEKHIIPGSRIIRKVVLRNPTRKAIFAEIQQHPSTNYGAIGKTLQLGANAVLWHLNLLIRFGCIQEIPFKTFTLFAIPEINPNKVIL